MNILDVRTLFISTAIISLYMAVILFVYRWKQKTYPGFDYWLAGNFLALITYLFFGLRGFIPDILSISGANALGILSSVLRLEGMNMFFKGTKLWVPNFILPILVLIVQLYFTLVQDSLNTRNLIFSIIVSLIAMRMSWILIVYSPKDTKAISLFLGTLLIIFVFGQAVRTSNWVLGSDNIGLLLNTPINSISILFLMIFDVSWGIVLMLLNSQRMNSEISQLTKQLEELASIDGLTGVYNRRKFLEIGTDELERAKRYGRHLSLLMFDLNNFKDVNDTYGHAAGDEALKLVIGVCEKHLRRQDVTGRFGGDEFIILLPETELSKALKIAENLNREIQSIPFKWANNLKLSISYGAADITQNDNDLNQLMHRADDMLYKMKYKRRKQSPTHDRTKKNLT